MWFVLSCSGGAVLQLKNKNTRSKTRGEKTQQGRLSAVEVVWASWKLFIWKRNRVLDNDNTVVTIATPIWPKYLLWNSAAQKTTTFQQKASWTNVSKTVLHPLGKVFAHFMVFDVTVCNASIPNAELQKMIPTFLCFGYKCAPRPLPAPLFCPCAPTRQFAPATNWFRSEQNIRTFCHRSACQFAYSFRDEFQFASGVNTGGSCFIRICFIRNWTLSQVVSKPCLNCCCVILHA